MKNILRLLTGLLIILSLAACTNNASKPKTNEELEKKMTTLKGTIIPYNIPMEVGIKLDTPIIIDEREVHEVYFDEDVITALVPRKYFTYYFQGGTSIDEEYAMRIPIKVEIVPNSFDYYKDLNRTSATITKVISIDGEENPQDKTNNEYTLDYYKTVFYTHCYNGNEMVPRDIKDTYFYKNLDDPIVGDEYKTAVDKILEEGLFIQMSEGEYMINEIEIDYFE